MHRDFSAKVSKHFRKERGNGLDSGVRPQETPRTKPQDQSGGILRLKPTPKATPPATDPAATMGFPNRTVRRSDQYNQAVKKFAAFDKHIAES